VVPLEDFEWTPEFLQRYATDHSADGIEGRLVMVGAGDRTWSSWERHPAGDELVFLISGRMRMIQEIDGAERPQVLGPGEAIINPKGVWHTVDVLEPGHVLFITPGIGTEHKTR
jgi:quercetin dioxygenase-like cupin family protein